MRTVLKIRQVLATGGVRGLLRLGLKQMRRRSRATQEPVSEFDTHYGIDTAGQIDQVDLDTHGFSNWVHGKPYEASHADLLRELVEASGIRPQEYTFVDLGCGKGRMVFSAIETGFAKAIGVEFSEGLLRAARENAAVFGRRFGQSGVIEFHQGDAGAFELPQGPLVVYLYNPFGPPVMREVVRRAATRTVTNGDRLWIWYHNPECAECWDSAGFDRVVELPELDTTIWTR